MARRIAIGIGAVIALWLVALVVMGVALGGRQQRVIAEKLGESLHGDVTIDDVDLALVRGRLSLDHLVAKRDDDVGHLAIEVASVRCELPPLGLALVDGECRELAIGGAKLEASSAALFKLAKPKQKPVHVRRAVIDDMTLVFSPTALLPSLGAVTIAIEHAEAGATTFRTPLSFLFALDDLRARIDLPAHISLRVGYHGGMFEVSGALFGTTPVAVPFQLPRADTARDAREEIDLLVAAGKDVAQRLVAQRAADFLGSKLK